MSPHRILLVGSCSSEPICAAFRLMMPTSEVVARPMRSLEDPDQWRRIGEDLREPFDTILAGDGLVAEFRQRHPDHPVSQTVPDVHLPGYHPDAIHAFFRGALIAAPVRTVWTSRIILGSFLRGLSPADCQRLFSEPFFRALGYFDVHGPSVRTHLERFSLSGLDGRWWLDRVSAIGSFLYSPNHPSPAGIGLLAYQLAISAGLPLERDLPFDKAAFWQTYLADFLRISVWPVYPEIADRFGLEGCYLFKGGDEYCGLDEFIQRCYSTWGAAGVTESDVTTHPAGGVEQFTQALNSLEPDVFADRIRRPARAATPSETSSLEALRALGNGEGPLHLYWEGDPTVLDNVGAAWSAIDLSPTVWSIDEVAELVESRWGRENEELFRAIRIPACRSFLARTVILEHCGGLFVDAHMGPPSSPESLNNLALELGSREVLLTVRATADNDPTLAFGFLIARSGARALAQLVRHQFGLLRDHRTKEIDAGSFTPYNLYALAGAHCTAALFFERPWPLDPYSVRPEWSDDLHIRVLTESETAPFAAYRYYDYRTPGAHWSERQRCETLFHPLGQ